MEPASERIKELFSAALLKPAAERDRFLTEACPDAPDLRSQVQSLLHAHEQAGEFLGQAGKLAPSGFANERAGSMIGRYKLLELIGEGGFGTVWMAEQLEPVRRRVALKIIKPGMDTKQVLARFEAERQALAMMDHPGIARVLDGGATDNGRPFFVMELVRGMPITDYCDANKLPTRERLLLFIQVCHAVQHAHQKGIIHRDLKPSNILVTEVDGAPVPKVIDFGVAKATQARLTELTLFTGLHQMIGTPSYMSPEQAGLGALDMDTRSDIYGLGVLLYELLTGRTPLTKEEFDQAGLDEIFRLVREKEPPKPSTRLSTLNRAELTTIATQRQSEPLKLNRLLAGDLDWIVMKALEKDRRRRYETAGDLASDLVRHLHNEPVTARPPGKVYKLQKAWRRNQTVFTSALLMALVLLAATIISVWQAVRARRAESLAMQRLAESEAMTKSLTEVAAHSHTIAEISNVQVFAYDDVGGQAAIELKKRILAFNRQTHGPEAPSTLNAMEILAESYNAAGQWDQGLKLQEEALALRSKTAEPDNADTINAMKNLAESYCSSGNDQQAIALLAKACELDPNDSMGPLHLAVWETWFGHDDDYEATRCRAIQRAEQANDAPALNRASKAYCLRPSTNAALLTKALTLAQRAVELSQSDPRLPWDQLALGLAQYRNGRYRDAERTLTIAEHGDVEFRALPGTSKVIRAMSLFRQNRRKEAGDLLNEAASQMPPLPPDDHKPLLDGKLAGRDMLIYWLAYKEARSLLNPSNAKP